MRHLLYLWTRLFGEKVPVRVSRYAILSLRSFPISGYLTMNTRKLPAVGYTLSPTAATVPGFFVTSPTPVYESLLSLGFCKGTVRYLYKVTIGYGFATPGRIHIKIQVKLSKSAMGLVISRYNPGLLVGRSYPA
jgi:hypothetical protein